MAITRDELLRFLAERLDDEDEEIADDTSLFGEGLLDSFILVELVTLIEKRLGIKVPPLEVNLRHFDTPERILRYVESKSSR